MSTDLAEELSRQTRSLLSRFEARVSSFSHRQDLAGMTVPVCTEDASAFAREYFGEGEHLAIGIDGSMDFDERLQMLLFYANSTAYSCHFTVGESLRFQLDSTRRESKLAASAAVPLWAEDLASVFSDEPEVGIELEHSVDGIPNSFMTLGELYLAYLACENAKVLFLDRPISGTYSTLSRDARYLMKQGECRLQKWSKAHEISILDLNLAVNLGSPTMAVPVRSRFLHLAFLKELMGGVTNVAAICSRLGVTETAAKRAIKRIVKIDKQFGNELLADASEHRLVLRESASGYWERVLALTTAYARDVFSRKRHPLALGDEEYLTILDVNTAAFILLVAACHRARTSGTLIVGIAKDTTATDVFRAVLPYSASAGFVRLSSPPPRLKNDRAFLAILSSENPSIKTPWRTLSYDSAFSTIVDRDGRLVSARKVVSREQLFARSYFQLRTLNNDSSVRSPVFLFDRTYDSRYDESSSRDLMVEERSGETEVKAYFEGCNQSALSNLVLHILSMSDNPEVFEAYGHNQLLYLADKAVKAEVRMLKSSLRGVADLGVGAVSGRRRIFGLVTPYRQQRAEAEHARTRR